MRDLVAAWGSPYAATPTQLKLAGFDEFGCGGVQLFAYDKQ